jgi:O-acetylserine/cysteine efflux transporter
MPPRHVLLAAAVAVVWGVNFVAIDVALDSFPPIELAALRFALLAFPAVLFIPRPQVGFGWVLAIGTFLYAGQYALLFTGMAEGMPAGLSSLVIQLQALFTIALAMTVLGERPGRPALVGAVVALAGIGVIALGRASAVPVAALALVVLAAASWGIGNVCTRAARAPAAMSMLVWASLVPPLPLALLSLATEGAERAAVGAPSAGGVLALLYVVVLSTGFGFGAWTWLIERHPASRVAPFALLVPVVGMGSAAVALGERPGAAEIIGASIVLAGLAIATGLVRRRRLPAAAQPVAASA